MRLALCLYITLFTACGSVQLKNADSGESSRGSAGDTGSGGSIERQGIGGAPAMDTMPNVVIDAAIDQTPTDLLVEQSVDAGQTTKDCSLCKLNCVSSVQFDGNAQAQFDYCDGCVSNCPVNGIKLLCHCNNGCGYNPTQGTCNE